MRAKQRVASLVVDTKSKRYTVHVVPSTANMPPHIINDTNSISTMLTNDCIGGIDGYQESTAEQAACERQYCRQPLPNFSNMMQFPSDWWPDSGEIHGFQQHFRRHHFTSILPTITEEAEGIKLFSKLKITLKVRKEAKGCILRIMKTRASVPRVE